MVQPAPAAKVAPQVPPAVKAGRTNTPEAVGTIGVSVMFMAVSGTVPVLASVTVCGALVVSIVWGGKAVVDRVRDGGTMVPVSVTDCGEPIPAFTVSVAAFWTGDATVGVKVTLIVQLPPTGTATQPGLVWPNCEEPAPPSVIPPTPVSVRAAWPVLVTRTG